MYCKVRSALIAIKFNFIVLIFSNNYEFNFNEICSRNFFMILCAIISEYHYIIRIYIGLYYIIQLSTSENFTKGCQYCRCVVWTVNSLNHWSFYHLPSSESIPRQEVHRKLYLVLHCIENFPLIWWNLYILYETSILHLWRVHKMLWFCDLYIRFSISYNRTLENSIF